LLIRKKKAVYALRRGPRQQKREQKNDVSAKRKGGRHGLMERGRRGTRVSSVLRKVEKRNAKKTEKPLVIQGRNRRSFHQGNLDDIWMKKKKKKREGGRRAAFDVGGFPGQKKKGGGVPVRGLGGNEEDTEIYLEKTNDLKRGKVR